MKKTTQLLLLLLSTVLLLTSGCASMKSTSRKAGFSLVYNFTPGQSFTMKNEGNTRTETDQMGQVVTVDINSMGEMVITPLTKDSDGSTNVELEFKTMSQSAQSPMGDGDTDYSSWIGKKVQFTVAPGGAISNYVGFDELPNLTSATGEPITGELMQLGMGNLFGALPDHPVKIGESWTENDSQDIPYGGKTLHTESTSIYTVTKKINKDGVDCLQIDVAGVTKLNGELDQEGMKLILTRETKTTSVLFFALDKGIYISSESKAVALGEIDVPDMGVTIPQKITSNSSSMVTFN